MLADLERTTHNNAEEMGSQFLQLSLLPHIVNWEQALRRSLLSPEERQRYTHRVLDRRHRPGGPGAALRGVREGYGRRGLDDQPTRRARARTCRRSRAVTR